MMYRAAPSQSDDDMGVTTSGTIPSVGQSTEAFYARSSEDAPDQPSSVDCWSSDCYESDVSIEPSAPSSDAPHWTQSSTGSDRPLKEFDTTQPTVEEYHVNVYLKVKYLSMICVAC